MPMYNLIEYSDKYLKTLGILWQYYREEPNATLTDPESFKSKIMITGSTTAARNTKNVETAVPSKYLSNFQRTLKMSLINIQTTYFIIVFRE